ncbi:MAG: hypothetical protein SFX73_32340 [Kofleriaceae bacterium]|nr:hypothetical protein [Kofleriaceae bacterium]
MRRIILLALTALTLTGGVAAADRDGRRGGVRDHRDNRWSSQRHDGWRHNNGWRRDNTSVRVSRYRDYDRSRYRVVRVNRARPVYRNNGFYFAGGLYRPYVRPVFNVRYTNYYARPQPIVENYETVPGYIWIAGSWQWNGYQWNWVAGRYEVDTSYQDNYYDGSVYYDYGY